MFAGGSRSHLAKVMDREEKVVVQKVVSSTKGAGTS